MTVFIGKEDWAKPRFRRNYWLLWLGIAVVIGLLCTQMIPSGVIEDCTVTSTENTSGGFNAVRIESSCGTFVAYDSGALSFESGATYDFHMRGFIVR
jgi:hypothetical protein